MVNNFKLLDTKDNITTGLQMMEENNPDERRLFFAAEVSAPWPHKLPTGRLLEEADRHMTLAFLGNIDYKKLKPILHEIPQVPFKVGITGYFDECLFLPERHPRVVAWNVNWLEPSIGLLNFRENLVGWLKQNEIPVDMRHPFLAHVTICRAPFTYHHWKKAFSKLPLMIKGIHLYETVGSLRYKPIWSQQLLLPFEEIEHTADIAFIIRGESIPQLFRHAFTALAFKYQAIVDYFPENIEIQSVEDIVRELNAVISQVDTKIGIPLKAVSYHGNVIVEKDQTLSWEMIVDV